MPRRNNVAATTEANLPIHTIRHRNLKATIWKNQTAKGAMYDVRVTRSYKEGDKWHDSSSFGYDDLMIVAKLLADGHSFISIQRANDTAAGTNAPRPTHRRADASDR